LTDFTSIALGSFLFIMCLSAVFIVAAPMFGQAAHENLMKDVGTQFADSEAGLEQVSNVHGYQEGNTSTNDDLTSYVVDKLEDVPENPSKGQFLGTALKMSSMLFGVFTRILFMRDIFPPGVMPSPFDTIFKVVFLVPFWISLVWVWISMLKSFVPMLSGGPT